MAESSFWKQAEKVSIASSSPSSGSGQSRLQKFLWSFFHVIDRQLHVNSVFLLVHDLHNIVGNVRMTIDMFLKGCISPPLSCPRFCWNYTSSHIIFQDPSSMCLHTDAYSMNYILNHHHYWNIQLLVVVSFFHQVEL
jgi:hypothetical protein